MSRAEAARRVAVEALVRVEEGAYAHILVPDLLRHRGLDPRGRALVTDLVYGTVRMQRAVDHLLGEFSSRPVAALDPEVARRSGSARTSSSPGPPRTPLSVKSSRSWPPMPRGFANGVLRSLAHAGPPWPLAHR